MSLSAMEVIVLKNVGARGADLRKVSEQYRQQLIALGMRDPPLVEVDADRVSISEAGRKAIA